MSQLCAKTNKPHRLKWVGRDRTKDRVTVRRDGQSATLDAAGIAPRVLALFGRQQGAAVTRTLGPIVHANVCQNCGARDR